MLMDKTIVFFHQALNPKYITDGLFYSNIKLLETSKLEAAFIYTINLFFFVSECYLFKF